LRVPAHERLRRSGYDLVLTERVALTPAVLGTELLLETLDGDEPLTLPPGTPSGKVFRLRAKGVPHVQSRGRGDLLVEVVVEIPTDLSETQEQLLRQLAAERGEPVSPIEEGGILHRLRSKLR
ncbi:MAG: DnaJ C-terminal domain-containing protein, partial [Acidimicrobiales bacterium]